MMEYGRGRVRAIRELLIHSSWLLVILEKSIYDEREILLKRK
jgi:hypothetical protein